VYEQTTDGLKKAITDLTLAQSAPMALQREARRAAVGRLSVANAGRSINGSTA